MSFSLSQSRLDVFIFVEENCCFLLLAHHTGLVISIFQSKNPTGWWWHPEFFRSELHAAPKWACPVRRRAGCSCSSLSGEAALSGLALGRICYPQYHLSGFGVITHPTWDIYAQMVRKAKRNKKEGHGKGSYSSTSFHFLSNMATKSGTFCNGSTSTWVWALIIYHMSLKLWRFNDELCVQQVQ